MKRNRLRIKNVLPINEEISKTSGEIVVRKDKDFDIIYFDLKIDIFFPACICLWPQNYPTCLPTTEVLITVSSLDSGYDFQ